MTNLELEPTAVQNNSQRYEIDIKTGPNSKANHEKIYLSLFGTEKNLLDLLIDKDSAMDKNTNKINIFDPNNLDKFIIYSKDVGKIRKISLRQDLDAGEPWDLSYIRILVNNDQNYTFTLKQELENDELDLEPDSDQISRNSEAKSMSSNASKSLNNNNNNNNNNKKEDLTDYEIQIKTAEDMASGTVTIFFLQSKSNSEILKI
jgi:hypothetical protein